MEVFKSASLGAKFSLGGRNNFRPLFFLKASAPVAKTPFELENFPCNRR
jgi:hypothetical protein